VGADPLPRPWLIDGQGKGLGKYYGSQAWDSPEAVALIAKTFRVKL